MLSFSSVAPSTLFSLTTKMADQEETKADESETTEEAPVTAGGDAPVEPADGEPESKPEASEEPKQEVTEDAPTESGDKAPEGEPEGDKPTEDGDKPPEESKPSEEGEKVEEGPEQQAEGEEKPAEGEEKPAEGEEKPAEGEEKPAEGEEKPAEGDAADAPQEAVEGTAAEGAEGNQEQAEGGEAEKSEGAEGVEAGEAEKKEGEEGEAAKEGEEGKEEVAEKPEGEGQKEGEEGPKEGEEEQKEGEAEQVPQSESFAEGEKPESPIGVGEKLSREGSPVADETKQVSLDVLEPGTPERSRPGSEAGDDDRHLETFAEEGELEEEEEEEDEEEEEEEEPEFDREALIERYNRSINEREQLQQQNYQLQHKLAEHFRKKKPDDSRQDYDKNANDQDSKYVKYMSQLDELRKQDMEERENYKIIIEELRKRCEEKKERVDEERNRFMEFKKQVAVNSLNNRSGKPIPPKDIETYLSSENKKEADVVNVRLENIKLKNKLKKKEQQLKSKEELAAGLHLIDFEQLKIENQTYNEKIEERNEELLKLRKKITSTVQVLTHLKEKLQFVQAENQVQKGTLREVESEVAQKRDILSRTKQARDALRIDNQRLRQSCGLLGNEPLLRDFEERKDEGDDLKQRLENLKMFHAELTLNCNQVRRKIEQAQAGRV